MTKAMRAPELSVSQWFNTREPLTLESQLGKVVVLHAFQMLCPGCVQHGVPQAERVHRIFAHKDVSVIGLHTVFEHHAAMMPVSLEAFLHEFKITHPVGVDVARKGVIRLQHFGRLEDMAVGAEVLALVAEA